MIGYSVVGYAGAAQRVGTSILLFYTISINKTVNHQGLMEKDYGCINNESIHKPLMNTFG